MKIAVCDDSATSAKIIYDTIVSHDCVCEQHTAIYFSAEELIESIKQKTTYDVVFLDIEMPKMNGIELGKILKEIDPNTYIVFVTSYPQYAIEAYDCEAYHYLLKPLDREKTFNIIDKILQKNKEKHKYHTVKIKGEFIYIPIKDIYYIECCQKHVIYHLKEKDLDTVGNISTANESLIDYGFLQVHQGYIVNMDKISYINKLSIVLIDGRTVPISVRKRTHVLDKYAKYMEEHY